MRAVRRERRHLRHIDCVDRFILNPLGAGITAVVVAAIVALILLFTGHPVEGAGIFGGVATLASVFVTGKIIRDKRNPPQ
jgi:uncharacterized membrane protein